MITYEQDRYGLKLLTMIPGSVFPGASKFAVAPALLAFIIRLVCELTDTTYDMEKLRDLYGSFIFVLGFVLVFRTGQAYNRYWDGANLLRQMRTEWHDACAQICCFTMTSAKADAEKDAFKICVVRLFSLLHCLGLQQIADMEDESFEVIDLEDFDRDLLSELKQFHEPIQKAEVVLNWIQRVILEGAKDGFIPTPPPIVSRSFQEINAGMVCLSKLQSITDNPFPFPYAQMIAALLAFHWVLTPILLGMIPISSIWCGLFAFISVFSLCALNLIAQEIENPFGDDDNDLRCDEAQQHMNEQLMLLLSSASNKTPKFTSAEMFKAKPKSRKTMRLSTFLPADDEGEEEAPAKKRRSVGDRRLSSADRLVQHGRRASSADHAVNIGKGDADEPKVNENQPGNRSVPETPGEKYLKELAANNSATNKSSADTPKAPSAPPALKATESAPPPKKSTSFATEELKSVELAPVPVIPHPLKINDVDAPKDLWIKLSGQLDESSQRAENLQKESISELKDVREMLKKLVHMATEGLNLALDIGVAVRPINADRQLDSGRTLKNIKDDGSLSVGACRLFGPSCERNNI